MISRITYNFVTRFCLYMRSLIFTRFTGFAPLSNVHLYIYIKDMIFSDLLFSPKHFPIILNQAIKSVNQLNECQVYKIQVSLKFHSAEISSVKEQFVAQEQNTMTWPGLEPRLPIPKATKSPHPYKGSPLNFLLFAKEQTYLLHPGVFQKQGAMF